jgi:hypothetical protein
VGDGQYSYEDSWKGMNILKQWLFNREKKHLPTINKKLHILEADSATSGENVSLSLTHLKKTSVLS